MTIDKVIEILESSKAPETEQDFDDFDTAIETAINLLKTHPDNQPNDPMTLDQLREIDGEPVWCHVRPGEWGLVNKNFEEVIFPNERSIPIHHLQGLAYRRKPEEEPT